jgi:glycosyltransferase involved in cell wall biosynthesis
MPSVSVLIVFHRATPFLEPAVRSVLDQTWRDLELVLIDNGTGLGLTPLGPLGRDPRVRLVVRPANDGFAAAFNAGLADSRSEFIALLDYDDISLPQRIEKQIGLLNGEPSLGLVSACAKTIDEQGRITGRSFALVEPRQQHLFSTYDNPSPTSTWTGRREVFERFAFRSLLEPAEDFDFVTRVVESEQIGGLPDVLLHYRLHAGQVSRQRGDEQVLKACLVRLITARRRAGRPENLTVAVDALGAWMTAPPARSAAYARFADWCLDEEFPLLAAYFARKLLSVRRDHRGLRKAVGVLAQALRKAPGRRIQLARLFFTGPLRTHGLTPL